jgi:hypothetical protein
VAPTAAAAQEPSSGPTVTVCGPENAGWVPPCAEPGDGATVASTSPPPVFEPPPVTGRYACRGCPPVVETVAKPSGELAYTGPVDVAARVVFGAGLIAAGVSACLFGRRHAGSCTA